ncbi:MAG: PKD domain-containing protein [bacterium]|nr:PKD domain-containing protein [bacterium]
MKNIKKLFWIFIMCGLTGLLFNLPLQADETLVNIAEQANFGYFKPEVKISPSGAVYVAYEAKNENTGRSEIYLSKYNNGNVTFVKNISESSAYSYEPEIDIPSNGHIHVSWCDQTNETTHVIKYRYFNGSSWSDIQTFGQVTNAVNIEDLRIKVDESGNVFVVFMYWNAAKCIFISKYGNNVSFEDFPLSGRSKHPDVDADDDYVHVTWQYKDRGDDIYTIAYQRRPNSQNSSWENWINLEYAHTTQRPRMSLDNSGTPHIVFFHNLGSTRRLLYRKRTGSSFSSPIIMSDPNNFETYHFCEIVAVSGDNVLVTMQRGGWSGGQHVSYNWRQNGQWSGFSFWAETHGRRPTKQSADMASDRFYAVIAFAERDDAVWLLVVEEDGAPGGNAPTARFTFSPQTGHAPLDVTFDGSGSTDSDGTVTNYRWNFGDGTTGTGQTIVHRYQNQGEYTIRLTVTDNDGKTASASHSIFVEPPNVPPTAIFDFTPRNGLYPLAVTFDASQSFDTDGDVVQYEWDFGGEQTGSGQTVSHTFTEEGLFDIILTVYDDDNASATASGTVEVLGLLPPQNISSQILENRNLFTIEYVAKLTWNRNPGNAARGANIVQYNIYRKRPDETAYTLRDTVTAQDANEYFDRIGTTREDYNYTVTAVDDQGRESDISGTASQRRWGPKL